MGNETVFLADRIIYPFLEDTITRPANTTAYADGDAISDVTTNDFFTLQSAEGREIGARTGKITGATLFSDSYVATGLAADILLFNNPDDLPTETADNATVAITDAEMDFCFGVLKFLTGGWTRGGANNIQHLNDLDISFQIPLVGAGSPGTPARFSIYAQAVARNAYVPISGEKFTLKLKIRVD